MRSRACFAFALGCFLGGLTLPSAAGAATIVGETAGVQDETTFCSPQEGVQDVSGAGAPSYTVPSDGVITSFRHRAGVIFSDSAGEADGIPVTDAADDQVIRMKAWRATADPSQFTAVGASDPELLTPGQLNEFNTRVPVQAGDMLGLTALTDVAVCAFLGVGGDNRRYEFNADTAVGSILTTTSSGEGNRWNIEATVEPDVDKDGYGDETQDACPSLASTQGPCPAPETTITFRPQFRHNTHSRFRFRSSISDSTFTCQMDDRRGKPCTSPANYRNLKTGTHTFSVFATSPIGQADPTPDKVTFEVRRKPKSERP